MAPILQHAGLIRPGLRKLAPAAFGAALWLLASCTSPTGTAQEALVQLTPEQLHDPTTCKACHAEHYREWQSSMHAYAAKDPVFFAMNERGQKETNGELGDFCVRCHAPGALDLGLTSDGLNLGDLKNDSARGVTCYVCHNATAVEDDHNQHLQLAHDTTFGGGLGNASASREHNRMPARANTAHASRYSELHDGTQLGSASLCGSCHDVVNGHGANIERTFGEWRSSRYAQPGPEQQSCGQCHMAEYVGRATYDGPERSLHRHLFAGVDVALERSFPGIDAQKAASDCLFAGNVTLDLRSASGGAEGRSFEVVLANRGVGHSFPSGSVQDRRAWVELIAYDAAGKAFFESGAIADGDPVPGDESGLVVLHDQLFDTQGAPAHMFWEAAPSDAHPLGYESDLLATGETRTLRYELTASPARVTARLLVRPIGLEVIDSFQGVSLPISDRVIDMGYLGDGPVRNRLRTRTVAGTEREWLGGGAVAAMPTGTGPTGCQEQSYVSQLPP